MGMKVMHEDQPFRTWRVPGDMVKRFPSEI